MLEDAMPQSGLPGRRPRYRSVFAADAPRLRSALILLFILFMTPLLMAKPYSWNQPHADVRPTGDLVWAPEPFQYRPGRSIRYIDFENGDDARNGASPEAAWKHHPWDANATANAATPGDADTYVFRGGITYRGELTVRGSGQPGRPIRLTRDPVWGTGPAVLCGSERVSGWMRGTDRRDIPDPTRVWHADLDFLPRSVWLVHKDATVERLPLAREPNWRVSNPDDLRSEWYEFDNPERHYDNKGKDRQGRAIHLATDTKHVRDRPRVFFEDALIRPEFGWVMSTPFPTRVLTVDLQRHALGFCGWTGGFPGSGTFHRFMRYYLEDKPQYLDDANGEFWFDRRGKGGRLYLRLPGDADPNGLHIEVGARQNLVRGDGAAHLEISGLTFRFTTAHWALDAVAWDVSTVPLTLRPEMSAACVNIRGDATDIRIANCRFEHVLRAISIQGAGHGQSVDRVRIEDNEIRCTDESAVVVSDGTPWGYAEQAGRLGDVCIYRNRTFRTGMRPGRYSRGTCIDVGYPRRVEIAGNIIAQAYAQGINVRGAKSSHAWDDVPFTRILIHHNRVWQSMLSANDFGGIETWQGGPAYVYDNLSYDARGPQYWKLKFTGQSSGFGHAYYLDGAFKNYHFNNIAWGRSNDPTTLLANCAAFQEIHSYQNTFFHNTVYNFCNGSRRQAPQAGRNKYLANIWQDLSERALRHADPANTEAAGNEADAGPRADGFALESNAYAGNVFHGIEQFGVLEPSGRWLATLDDFRNVLRRAGAPASEVGSDSERPPLRQPEKGDFRPAPGAELAGRSLKVFVPWALCGVVAEWPFLSLPADPGRIMDEHWYMTGYHVDRQTYRRCPMYPLEGVNISDEDYVNGELEDWTRGAVRFRPERGQFARLANARITAPYTVHGSRTSVGEPRSERDYTFEGEALRSPQVYMGNFLVEMFFRTERGASGLLLSKTRDGGYALYVGADGRARFEVAGTGSGRRAVLRSAGAVADGRWHHLVAEADRGGNRLTFYLDGKLDTSGAGVGAVSLANDADLYVAGSPAGDFLAVTFDFIRIAQGTLADADTTIEELYAWEFDGPHLRDFA
ncbi:MAG: right-handed parallel beta-helix repeat-containing protein, partial [Lentisphaerae bacterium]|nr:right-handed parallel beta-helix repeat-containing protein [Lentisphaerota bacterium]